MPIPTRIFQTWKTKFDLPAHFGFWSSTFRAKNPGYDYVLWDDNDNRDFIASNFGWFLGVYDTYPAEIYRADVIRYFFLYTFGGIYADIDTECLKSLDGLLCMGDVVLGQMGSNRSFSHSIPNAIMASAPKQEFWLLVIGYLMETASQFGTPEYETGPVLLKAAVDTYLDSDRQETDYYVNLISQRLRSGQEPCTKASRLTILDSRQYYPLDWSNSAHETLRQEVLRGCLLDESRKSILCDGAWMVTYWQHTWSNP